MPDRALLLTASEPTLGSLAARAPIAGTTTTTITTTTGPPGASG